jgi:hypothetical protein
VLFSDINTCIPTGVEFKKYVDDILYYILGNLRKSLPQEVVDGVSMWCEVNKVSLNIKKCKVMTMNRNNYNPVNINNQAIEEVNSLKYLGIEINSKLNWINNGIEFTKVSDKLLSLQAQFSPQNQS